MCPEPPMTILLLGPWSHLQVQKNSFAFISLPEILP